MSNRKRVAEGNVGAFYGGVVQISLPIPAVGVEPRPGNPRPEDEWRVPMGQVETEENVILEPVRSDGVVTVPIDPTNKA
jgi:hypothetical protein